MANFNTAYHIVAQHEGGFQIHPNDSGNYNSLGQLVGTNWGISAPVYESYLQRAPSQTDMQTMSKLTAANIFKTRFWDRIKGDQIHNQEVATIFFDGIVNHGSTGVKIMQRVLGVTADGAVGPITLSAINKLQPAQLYLAYREARKNFYKQLATDKPALAVFLNGWLRRINSFTAFGATGTQIASGGSGMLAMALALFGIYTWSKK